jgi:hypothetical protein
MTRKTIYINRYSFFDLLQMSGREKKKRRSRSMSVEQEEERAAKEKRKERQEKIRAFQKPSSIRRIAVLEPKQNGGAEVRLANGMTFQTYDEYDKWKKETTQKMAKQKPGTWHECWGWWMDWADVHSLQRQAQQYRSIFQVQCLPSFGRARLIKEWYKQEDRCEDKATEFCEMVQQAWQEQKDRKSASGEKRAHKASRARLRQTRFRKNWIALSQFFYERQQQLKSGKNMRIWGMLAPVTEYGVYSQRGSGPPGPTRWYPLHTQPTEPRYQLVPLELSTRVEKADLKIGPKNLDSLTVVPLVTSLPFIWRTRPPTGHDAHEYSQVTTLQAMCLRSCQLEYQCDNKKQLAGGSGWTYTREGRWEPSGYEWQCTIHSCDPAYPPHDPDFVQVAAYLTAHLPLTMIIEWLLHYSKWPLDLVLMTAPCFALWGRLTWDDDCVMNDSNDTDDD